MESLPERSQLPTTANCDIPIYVIVYFMLRVLAGMNLLKLNDALSMQVILGQMLFNDHQCSLLSEIVYKYCLRLFLHG